MDRLEKVKTIKNAVEKQHYNLKSYSDYQVKFIFDETMEHGSFLKQGNTWLTTKQTYQSMHPQIFALDENNLDIKQEINCADCKKLLDTQFWTRCPFCTKAIEL